MPCAPRKLSALRKLFAYRGSALWLGLGLGRGAAVLAAGECDVVRDVCPCGGGDLLPTFSDSTFAESTVFWWVAAPFHPRTIIIHDDQTINLVSMQPICPRWSTIITVFAPLHSTTTTSQNTHSDVRKFHETRPLEGPMPRPHQSNEQVIILDQSMSARLAAKALRRPH